MECYTSVQSNRYDGMYLPTGFRFHPTDQELIADYLSRKVNTASFSTSVIGEVDLNRCEPWELPFKARMGEKSWYFFCLRDRKYPTGCRTNRATEAGYWKATGKDKEIYRAKILIGMKKTLVFYRGRAPKGEKTHWFMHEYRLAGQYWDNNLPKTARNFDWVLCRVFHKDLEGRKDKEVVRLGSSTFEGAIDSPLLPPTLMDDHRNSENEASLSSDSAHVTCFSNAFKGQEVHGKLLVDCYSSAVLSAADGSQFLWDYLNMPSHGSAHYSQEASTTAGMQQPGSNLVQVVENNGLISVDIQEFNVENEFASIAHERKEQVFCENMNSLTCL